MTDRDRDREAFEKWAKFRRMKVSYWHGFDRYDCDKTTSAWRAWQTRTKDARAKQAEIDQLIAHWPTLEFFGCKESELSIGIIQKHGETWSVVLQQTPDSPSRILVTFATKIDAIKAILEATKK